MFMFKTKKEIEEWIINNSFKSNLRLYLPKFIINDDLTVDCEFFSSINSLGIKELPFKFRKVERYFNLGDSGIKNLKGFPESCDRLIVSNNNLNTLEGCPKDCIKIECINNPIYEFKELPFNIEKLYCSGCPIYEIYGLFGGDIKIFKEALDHAFHLGGNRILKSGLEVAIEEYNDLYGKDMELPKKLENYIYV